MKESSGQSPIYARVTEVLRAAIRQERIPVGTVLLEGHIADLLKITRTPVRQALRELEDSGLVRRFKGRGVLTGSEDLPPLRIPLTPAMLGIDVGGSAVAVRKAPGWEAIYERVERDVLYLSMFQASRLNEVEMARYFGVGRLVARDVLLRLESLGLVEKDERLRWLVIPLDTERVHHLYDLRRLLEPAALAGAMTKAPPSLATTMLADLKQAMRAYPDISASELDKLEHDLHVVYLSHCPNKPLLQSLQRTRCILTISKHVLGDTEPIPESDPFMASHSRVLEAVAAGNSDLAQAEMLHHLDESLPKVARRVELIRCNFPPLKVPYAD